MRKIPTIFERDPGNLKRVLDKPVDECQWVFDGGGVPTEKFDGSACLVHSNRLYRRHRAKAGRTAPDGWLHWDFDPAATSGHGWLPVSAAPSDVWHREACARPTTEGLHAGTYELVGPSVQDNPYRLAQHDLWAHGSSLLSECERTFEGIAAYLAEARPMEGIVWHHPDGRMAKIKRRDFGLPWPVKA